MCVGARQPDVDGGIGPTTIRNAYQAGARVFVAGSSVFDRPDYTAAISELKGNAFASYDLDQWTFRYQMEYISGVEDNRGPVEVSGGNMTYFGVGAEDYIQHDLHAFWEVPTEIADVTLNASVENFTDEDPAAARTELSYNPFVGNALGRTFTIGAKIRY